MGPGRIHCIRAFRAAVNPGRVYHPTTYPSSLPPLCPHATMPQRIEIKGRLTPCHPSYHNVPTIGELGRVS